MTGRSSRVVGCLCVWSLVCAVAARAGAEIAVDFDTTIDYELHDDVRVVEGTNPIPPTVLEVAEPASITGTLWLMDASVANVRGGTLREPDETDTVLHVLGHAVANILGGDVTGEARVGEFGTLNIHGGYVEDADANALGTMNIHGGTVESPDAFGSATVNVYSGVLTGPGTKDSGSMNIYGGEIHGQLRSGLAARDDAVIRVFGTGFNYPYGAIPDSVGSLTGVLASGDPIAVDFLVFGDASIVLVPEPVTLALLSAAALPALLARRRRRTPDTRGKRAA